jgi:hypothetical protein
MIVFWDVTLYSLVEVYRPFRGACCLHHKGDDPVTVYEFYHVYYLLLQLVNARVCLWPVLRHFVISYVSSYFPGNIATVFYKTSTLQLFVHVTSCVGIRNKRRNVFK